MGIDLTDPRFTCSDEAPQLSLPPEGAVAERNGHSAGPQTPLEVEADRAELHRREQLLRVTSNSIATVLTAHSVKEGLPHVMQQFSQVLRIDRMSVVEAQWRADPSDLVKPYYVWIAPGAPPPVNMKDIVVRDDERNAVADLKRLLSEGKAVFCSQRTSPPALWRFLSRLNVISVFLIPVRIRGERWGQIAFSDCGNERDWATDEISALRLFADVIGVAITRERSREELLDAQSKLVITARQAGMAEIANNVLHNVGNVLNSVNVSAGLIGGRIRDSKAQGLAKAVRLMNEHATDLGDFLTRDERGKALPGYLNKLVAALAEERQSITDELGSLTKGIDHIKEIVATQQSYSGATSVIEPVQIKELMEDALSMNTASMARHQITMIKEFAAVPLLLLDKHLLLQILVNLIGNAKQAMNGVSGRAHQITLRVDIAGLADEPRLRIRVEDNGEGIAPENLGRLFTHGFTTRKSGHGFGLHSCALVAKEMNGTMTAHSDGLGKGAAFTLELPVKVA
jgi:signal transduction histidine kinase